MATIENGRLIIEHYCTCCSPPAHLKMSAKFQIENPTQEQIDQRTQEAIAVSLEMHEMCKEHLNG